VGRPQGRRRDYRLHARQELRRLQAEHSAAIGCRRQFEIIGEALGQLAKGHPEIAASVPDLARIVAFRNILIHGYAAIDHETVWRVVQENLPALDASLAALLGPENEPSK
jgi:uncharacterized protein with HEPN domain